MDAPEPIDTSNDFLVGVRGDDLVVMRPLRGCITKAEALRLAAWLVVLADPLGEQWAEVMAAVRTT
jgi:hypothetical protein